MNKIISFETASTVLYKNRLSTLSVVVGIVCFILLQKNVHAQIAPGGVSADLNYWIKADAGVTTFNATIGGQAIQRVSDWTNQTPGSTNGLSGDQDFRRPVFIENGLNFNPAINFDGNNDFLRTDNGWDSHSVIVVFNPTENLGANTTVQTVLVYDVPNNNIVDSGIGLGNLSTFSSAYAACSNNYFWNSGDQDVPGSVPEFVGCSGDVNNSTDDAVIAVVRPNVNETLPEHKLWGQDQVTTVINPQEYGVHSDRPFTVGQRHGGGLFYEGDVLEAISYSSRVSDQDIRKIESYLAVKYGLTLNQNTPQNYLSSTGASIYDIDNSYNFNIAGIGRDDASGLNQKQSTSSTINSVHTNNPGIVTVGLNNLANTNANNMNSFTNDLSFLLWANNGASTSISTLVSSVPNGGVPINRMDRIWKIQETGTVGDVVVSISQNFFNDIPVLLVSQDDGFNSTATVVELSDDMNGNYSWTWNFSPGDFFTFGETVEIIDCPPVIIVDQTFSAGDNLSFEASQEAVVFSIHNDGSVVDVSAANQVEMTSGFMVNLGAEFHAFIGGCL